MKHLREAADNCDVVTGKSGVHFFDNNTRTH